MYKKLVIISFIVFSLATILGCTQRNAQHPIQSQTIETSSQNESSVISSLETESTSESTQDSNISFDATAEKYYDYVQNNSHISMLLADEKSQVGFTDSEMSAFAIGELIQLGTYDYEKGNTKEEYDAITEKYFGKKIENFENSKSKIIPATGNITSTGWGGSPIDMVLKDMVDNNDGSKTATFYRVMGSMGENTPAPEKIKNDLLSRHFENYGTVWLTEIKFEEKIDENGKMYMKFIDIVDLGEVK